MSDFENIEPNETPLDSSTLNLSLPTEIIQDDAAVGGEENEDPTVCEICLDGEVFDDNEILFCDKCNIPVHQLCYGVTSVPAGSWFCYPCSAGVDPHTLACELCSNVGGAYKVTDRGKWAHPLCASWVPEIYELYPPITKVPALNLINLDKKRFKLKCALCTSKGACIQCCYGRCTTAAHPWCVLKAGKGFTRRIIKNEEGQLIWEVFCKTHAKAVSEPLKPKPKSKMSVPLHTAEDDAAALALEEEADERLALAAILQKPKSKLRYSESYDSSGKPRLTMAHAQQFSNSCALIYANDDDDDRLKKSTTSDKLLPPSQSHEDGLDGAAATSSRGRAAAGFSNAATAAASFPILNLNEWPGQSEGEAMDLDHYWRVVSAYYPEDHPTEWLDFMTAAFLDMSVEAQNAVMRLEGDAIVDMPPLGRPTPAKMKDLAESAEEALSLFGGERDQKAVFDLDKRFQTLSQVGSRVGTLLHAAPEDMTTLDENSFYTEEMTQLETPVPIEEDAGKDEDGLSTLRVVFDGVHRVGCEFKVQFPLEAKEASKEVGDGFSVVKMLPSDAASYDQWTQENLLPSSNNSGLELDLTKLEVDGDVSAFAIRLDGVLPITESDTVSLVDRRVVARDEDNTLCRSIRTDQRAYAALVHAIHQKVTGLLASQNLSSLANSFFSENQQWREIDQRYSRQQVWKQVCNSVFKGVRDQQPDFNKVEAESVPASWAISVDGRPPVAPADDEENEEVHEDAVCMCCFDGSSSDTNRILFCDGCNAALHQTCYGVSEIPEGDFFCDRCRYVQIRAADTSDDWNYNDGDLKNAVMCSLCPLYHAGFKPTTDGRWVHLCCAVWSNQAVIYDLAEMGPVDVSEVRVQALAESEDVDRRGRKIKKTLSYAEDLAAPPAVLDSNAIQSPDITDPCMFCNVSGGLVVRCSHVSGNESATDCESACCKSVFHPICAWFDGMYMRSTITDITFQGVERDGKYPSGLSFEFLCDAHSASVRPSPSIKKEQSALRNRYRIREDDLEQIPERNKRKRKKPKAKKKESGSGVGRKTMASSQVFKDLNPDTYDDATCAICLEPTSTDVFSCGFDPKVLAEDLAEFVDCPVLSGAAVSDVGASEAKDNNHSSDTPSSSAAACIGSPSRNLDKVSDRAVINSPNHDHVPLVLPHSAASPQSLPPLPSHHTPSSSQVLNNSSSSSSSAVKVVGSPSTFANNSAFVRPVNKYTDRSVILKCKQCGIAVHQCCVAGCSPVGVDVSNSEWRCDKCVSSTPEETDVRCLLCPRRGGYLKRSNEEGRWVHSFCAAKAPFHCAVLPNNQIDVRAHAKENRKAKCVICNRKGGSSVHCGFLGCTAHFHPICGVRSGRALIRDRQGSRQVFCLDHLPEGVERLPSGYWVDGYELQQLRFCLDRARLILDVLLRREKVKKIICKTELEWFNARFKKTVAKVTGKKLQGEGGLDLSEDDLSLEDSDSDQSDLADFDEIYGEDTTTGSSARKAGRPNSKAAAEDDDFVPIVSQQYALGDKEVTVPLLDGEVAVVSATWTKRGELRLPKRISVTYSGLDVQRKDAMRDGGKTLFLKENRELLLKNLDASRQATMLFASQRDENDFGRKIGPQLLKHMTMQNDVFRAEMEKLGLTKISFGPKKKSASAAATSSAAAALGVKKVKKGYALVVDHEDAGDEEYVDPHKAKAVTVAPKSATKRRLELTLAEPEEAEVLPPIKMRGRPSIKAQQEQAAAEELVLHLSASAKKSGKGKKEVVQIAEVVSSPEPVRLNRKGGARRAVELTDEELEEQFYLSQNLAVVAPPSAKKGTGKAVGTPKDITPVVVGRKRGSRNDVLWPDSKVPVDDDLTWTLEDSPATQKSKKQKGVDVEVPSHRRTSLKDRKGGVSSEEDHSSSSATTLSHKKKSAVSTTSSLYPPYHSAFFSRAQLEKQLESDQLGKSLLHSLSNKHPVPRRAPGFQPFFDRFNSHLTAADLDLSDWQVYSSAEVYRLERRLKDILMDLETKTVPDEEAATEAAAAPSSSKKSNASAKAETPVSVSGSARKSSRSVAAADETAKTSPRGVRRNGNLVAPRTPATPARGSEPEPFTRELAAEFSEVPYEAVPDYEEHVRKVVTLASMAESLIAHEYRSLAEFAKDFFSLLNNARSITPANSLIWSDSQLLAEVFEAARIASLTTSSCANKAVLTGRDIRVKEVSAARTSGRSSSSDKRVVHSCFVCQRDYEVLQWPAECHMVGEFIAPPSSNSDSAESSAKSGGTADGKNRANYSSNGWAFAQLAASQSQEFEWPREYLQRSKDSAETRKTREPKFRKQWADAVRASTWQWMCPSCVGESGRGLVGCKVKVWWHDDGEGYTGQINAFDETMGLHRVLYDDNEWEFLNLGVEPVVYHAPESSDTELASEDVPLTVDTTSSSAAVKVKDELRVTPSPRVSPRGAASPANTVVSTVSSATRMSRRSLG